MILRFSHLANNSPLKRIRQICIGKLVKRLKFDFKIEYSLQIAKALSSCHQL